MLTAKLNVQAILELGQRLILLAGNGYGRGLVACSGGVCSDLVFQRVVVEVVWGTGVAKSRGESR